MEEKLNEFIISLIGNRPINRNYQFNHLLSYYLQDIEESDKRRNFYETLKAGLYVPVIAEEAKPIYQQLETDIYSVLVDCFDEAIACLITAEMDFRELYGCPEEVLVLEYYNARYKLGLVKAINNLLEKVEVAALSAVILLEEVN